MARNPVFVPGLHRSVQRNGLKVRAPWFLCLPCAFDSSVFFQPIRVGRSCEFTRVEWREPLLEPCSQTMNRFCSTLRTNAHV